MKVLIFGGTGWVGHHIALELIFHKYDVTVATRGQKAENYQFPLPSGVRRVIIDKNDENSMKELLAEKFEIIIDSVPGLKSIANIFKYAAGLRHYLHCSSTGGYAPLPFVPCNETAPYPGGSCNAWGGKGAVDSEVMRLFNVSGFPATVIRPCYITGGADRFPLDNYGDRREDFIPDLMTGKVIEVPNDGKSLLQPIHVADLAASFRLAIENRRSIGERYNICLEHALTLDDYVQLNAEAVGHKAIIKHVPLEELLARNIYNEVGLRFVAEHMCFTIEKARSEIGYVPKYTPEEAIVETARAIAAKLK